MPGDDLINRNDLEAHCERQHGPLVREMDGMTQWVRNVDNRLWALVVGVFLIFVTSALTLFVSIFRPIERAPVQSYSVQKEAYSQASTDTSCFTR